MKVLELRGYKSIRVLNAFHALMLGLKMLPAYMAESYEEFFARIEKMTLVDQEKILREAAQIVAIEQDELNAIVSFVTDANGVPYGSENIKNLSPKELVDIIVAVCLEIAKMKIDLVTGAEKKNSET